MLQLFKYEAFQAIIDVEIARHPHVGYKAKVDFVSGVVLLLDEFLCLCWMYERLDTAMKHDMNPHRHCMPPQRLPARGWAPADVVRMQAYLLIRTIHGALCRHGTTKQ